MNTFQGSCHCGSVKFQVSLDPEECFMCDCSLCAKKGSIMNRVSAEDVRILSGESVLSTYKFNTGIASHYFCSNCGIHVFHNPRTAPELVAVNVRCIPEINVEAIEISQVHGSELS